MGAPTKLRAAELGRLDERAQLKLSSAGYKVFRRLLRHADGEGYCWPSVRTLRRMRGTRDRHTVFAALKELEARRFVWRAEMTWAKTGARAVSLYRIGAPVRKLPERARERGFALVGRKRTAPSVKKAHYPPLRILPTTPVGKIPTENSSHMNICSRERNPPHSRGVNRRGMFEEQARKRMSKELVGVTPERVRQAARLASLLASSPPNSLAYYCRAIPDIAQNFEAKLLSWLSGHARRRLGDKGNLCEADLVEELKCLAAHHKLPYNSELVAEAIDCALRRVEDERQAQAELRVGEFGR